MHRQPHAQRLLRYLVVPKAIIFGVCLVNFVGMLVHVYRVDLQIKASGYLTGHWYPGAVMLDPFLLLVSAAALVLNRSWSLCVALLLSGRVVYTKGYLSWIAVHNAHDVPMFSRHAMELLLNIIFRPRPEYLLQLMIATVVFLYAVALLTRVAFSRRAVPLAGR